MRGDQLERIETLATKLADTFIEQANPDTWTGKGIIPANMDKEQRGSRNWDIKNANQLGALLIRTLDLKHRFINPKGPDGQTPDKVPGLPAAEVPGDAVEDDIGKYEKEAKQLLASVGRARG